MHKYDKQTMMIVPVLALLGLALSPISGPTAALGAPWPPEPRNIVTINHTDHFTQYAAGSIVILYTVPDGQQFVLIDIESSMPGVWEIVENVSATGATIEKIDRLAIQSFEIGRARQTGPAFASGSNVAIRYEGPGNPIELGRIYMHGYLVS